MKPLLIIFGLLICINSYCQRHTEYTVGLKKTGAVIDNVEGQIVVTDSTVHVVMDGKTTTSKITKREGYTLHVTDGATTGKYVIAKSKGRLHGFDYDSSITYHPTKHVAGTHLPTYLCAVKKD